MAVKNKIQKPRVADEIMEGMRELQRMMDEDRTPEQMFTVKTIEVPDPRVYRASHIRLRSRLGSARPSSRACWAFRSCWSSRGSTAPANPVLWPAGFSTPSKPIPRWLATLRETAVA